MEKEKVKKDLDDKKQAENLAKIDADNAAKEAAR